MPILKHQAVISLNHSLQCVNMAPNGIFTQVKTMASHTECTYSSALTATWQELDIDTLP